MKLDREKLLELAARCEAATGPDRELDEAVWEGLGNCSHKRTKYYFIEDGNDYDSGHTCLDCGKDTYGVSKALAYTASLDAAMTLVPEGCGFAIRHHPELIRKTWCEVWSHEYADPGNDPPDWFKASGATPALALTATAIRALAGETE